MRESAKMGSQVMQNQLDNIFSAQHYFLLWAYRMVYETLCKLRHGEGFPPELAKVFAEEFSFSTPEQGRFAEPETFARLIRATAPRTVRKIVNQSCLRGSRLGISLRGMAQHFLEIKASKRFPKSPEKQVEFIARGFGALIAGYKPSTGDRYLAVMVRRCQQCGERPVSLDFRGRSWCGDC